MISCSLTGLSRAAAAPAAPCATIAPSRDVFVTVTPRSWAAARGRGEEALAAFSQAEALAREMGMRPQVWQAQAAAASLLTQQGRQAEALAQRQSARRLIGEIADGITDATRRAYYLDHALTQL